MRRLVLTIFLFNSILSLRAALVEWDGGEGTVRWSDAKNWSGDMLPGIMDSVLIDGAAVQLDVLALIASIRLEGGAILTIQSGQKLKLDGSEPFGLDIHKATITNYGTIEIPTYQGTAIRIKKDGIMNNQNQIMIFNIFSGEGILNFGIVNNFDSLTIRNLEPGYEAIENFSEATFNNHGLITIELVGETAIVNSSEFTNDGSIEIKDVDGNNLGLLNNVASQFLNTGIINISANGMYNLGNFVNENVLHIRNVNQIGLFNIDSFLNSGFIDIDSVYSGIQNNGFFENSNNIMIQNAQSVGIWNNDGYWTNQGMIEISDSMNTGLLVGILSSGDFINNDSIFLSFPFGAVYGIVNDDSLDNQSNGVISISSEGGSKIEGQEEAGISNESFMMNIGKIFMHYSGFIMIRNSGDIINQDSIILEQNYAETYGLLNKTNSTFQNQEHGVLTMTSALNSSVYSINNQSDSMSNDGHIIIDHFGQIINYRDILNSAFGSIRVSVSNQDPFQNLLGATFDCQGILEVGN